MPRSPKVKAAVLERSRRSTAGKRMSSLVGKAQEDDEAFWSHSIWSEAGGGFSDGRSRKRRRGDDETSSSSGSEDGSDEESASDGEGSYRMSDEDSEAAVDQFDSDFDESESDEEEEEGEGEEELELRAQERREKASKRKKNQRLGVPMKSSAGRELMKKKTGKMTKRGPMGTGWNEGLVLNWPPQPLGGVDGQAVAKSSSAATVPLQTQKAGVPSAAIPGAQSIPAAPPAKPQHLPAQPPFQPTAGAKKAAKVPPPSPREPHLRAAAPPSPSKPKQTRKQQRQAAAAERKKQPRRQFTQEEMILESIKSTETDNAKWLSSRKRTKEEAAQLEKASANAKKSAANHKPVSRFRSRRGCSNTLTFMDMDHLPEILTRRHTMVHSPRGSPYKRRRVDSTTSETSETAQSTSAEKDKEKCLVTGKVARYRDPKTNLGYHDLDAYKELKRRVSSGELKVSQPVRANNNRRRPGGKHFRPSPGKGMRGSVKTTTVPFAPGQPTMVAEVTSIGQTAAINGQMKVMVTQGGAPVSPPTSTKPPAKLPALQVKKESLDNRKEPPPLLPSPCRGAMINRFLMGRMGDGGAAPQRQQTVPLAAGSQGVQKDPPPQLPMVDVSQGTQKDLLPLMQPTEHDDTADLEDSLFSMGGLGIDFGAEAEHEHVDAVADSKPTNGVPEETKSSDSQPVAPALPAKPAHSAGRSTKQSEASGKSDGSKLDAAVNNIAEVGVQSTKDDSAKPVAVVSGTNANGGSKGRSKSPPEKDVPRNGDTDMLILV